MNKEKEIEEMAEVIDKRIDFANDVIGSMNKSKGHWISEWMFPTYRKADEVRKETIKEILCAVDDEAQGATSEVTRVLRRRYGVEVDE